MSAKHWRDHEIEFRKKPSDAADPYPDARGLVVYLYAGTLEECVARARKQFDLGSEWELVGSKAAGS